MAFIVTSPAFRNGNAVPKQFTCDGSDTPPPLEVSGAPEGTRSFAVIMDDPDAPNGTFTHWLAYDVPTGAGRLQVDRGKTLRNSFGGKATEVRAHRRVMECITTTSPSTPWTSRH